MHEVIPSINCVDEACIRERIGVLRGFYPHERFVHLDIADGSFTFNKLWNDPGRWQEFKSPYQLEVHLMIEEPEKHFLQWLKIGAKRILLHYETIFDSSLRASPIDGMALLKELLVVAKNYQSTIMLTQNPETSVESFLEVKHVINEFQILSVHPGLPGQNFLESSLKKISFLREKIPGAIIEVDGGVSKETASSILGAGADLLVASHAIFDAPDPSLAYRELISL